MTGLLRNMNAKLAGRGLGTVEYEIALAPGDQHNHVNGTSSTTAPGPDMSEGTG
jgi:hypothetical protein